MTDDITEGEEQETQPETGADEEAVVSNTDLTAPQVDAEIVEDPVALQQPIVLEEREEEPPSHAAMAPKSMAEPAPQSDLARGLRGSFDLASGMASGAARFVSSAAGASFRFGRAMLRPERLEMMAETGSYLREMRELGGLTLMELSEALDLEDKTLLEAVENGTATLSFELILRVAAVVARHDPVPFVMELTRTYNPSIWRILHDWGIGKVSLQLERERRFVNLLRRHDGARKLSDEGFAKVLGVTEAAFEMALFYALKEEGIEDKLIPDSDLSNSAEL